MKARDLKPKGYELVIDKRGRAVWIKPLVTISEDSAPEISPAQLAELERVALAAANTAAAAKNTPTQ